MNAQETAATAAQTAAQVAVVAANQATTAAAVTDHEGRLRNVEAAVIALQGLPALITDLEGRQRADERWRYAMPLTALTALGALLAALAGAASAIYTAFGKGG